MLDAAQVGKIWTKAVLVLVWTDDGKARVRFFVSNQPPELADAAGVRGIAEKISASITPLTMDVQVPPLR